MGCSELMEWPAGVMKLCQVVFNLVVVICLAVAGFYPVHQWFLLIILLTAICILVVILFVCGQSSKEWLLVYYTIGFSFTFVCLEAYYGAFYAKNNPAELCAMIFTLFSFAVYIASLLLNVLQGSP